MFTFPVGSTSPSQRQDYRLLHDTGQTFSNFLKFLLIVKNRVLSGILLLKPIKWIPNVKNHKGVVLTLKTYVKYAKLFNVKITGVLFVE
jgi:hypothetical protein